MLCTGYVLVLMFYVLFGVVLMFFFVKICFVCASKLLGHFYITTVRVRQEQIFSFFQLDVFEHF